MVGQSARVTTSINYTGGDTVEQVFELVAVLGLFLWMPVFTLLAVQVADNHYNKHKDQ